MASISQTKCPCRQNDCLRRPFSFDIAAAIFLRYLCHFDATKVDLSGLDPKLKLVIPAEAGIHGLSHPNSVDNVGAG